MLINKEARTVTPTMRSGLFWLAIFSVLAGTPTHQAGGQSSVTKSLHAFLAVREGSKRTTTFSADAPAIYVFWKGEGLAIGDTVRAIWIAEDVGAASPKDTEIRRADLKVYKQEDEHGAFSLSRPRNRAWPVGKYRVELYLNGGIAEVAKFTINPGVTIETH
jgi:hypothetical protein